LICTSFARKSASRLAIRDDLQDIVGVLAERLTDFDLRITSAVGQVAESMASQGKTLAEPDKVLAEILERLPGAGG
jgi:hypothetical protein